MTRVLKRPMFRLGGPANEGITSGLAPRQGYDKGELVKSAEERKKVLSKLVGQRPDTSLSQFMIDFGLDIASRSPEGSIFSTAAASAKEPFKGYKTSKAQRGAFDQQIGLSAAESAIAHADKMKELALKGQTTDLLTEQKRAKIMWNNRRTETNPNGSYNTDTGEDWKSYQEVEAFVVDKAIKSKTGEYTPKVEKDIAINEQKEYIMENIVENPVDAQEVAEIGYAVQNDKLYEEIKDKFDFTQYIIEAEDFGDKLPATETAGATQHIADLDTGRSPDYQHGKIYYNMQDNQFYMFSEAGPGFILITMTQE
jgi:hypothetical protein